MQIEFEWFNSFFVATFVAIFCCLCFASAPVPQEQQDKAIQKAVEQALDARWQRQSKLEPSIGGAVGRVELMELMVLKRDLQAQLPALATMRSTFETLTARPSRQDSRLVPQPCLSRTKGARVQPMRSSRLPCGLLAGIVKGALHVANSAVR